MTAEPRQEDSFPTELHCAFDKLEAELQDEGPPVDYALVQAYFDRELIEEDVVLLKTNVVRWREWYEAFWETHRDYALLNRLGELEAVEEIQGRRVLDRGKLVMDKIHKQVEKYTSSGQGCKAFDPGKILDFVQRDIFDDEPLNADDESFFYRFGAEVVRKQIEAYARKRIETASEQTAKSRDDETVLATADTAPATVLKRMEELEKLKTINQSQARVYELATFGGRKRREIAALLQIPYEEVRKQLAIATAEVEQS